MATTAPASDVLGRLWNDLALPATALQRLRLTGREPVLPSSFAVGTAAQASLAAAALAATEIGKARNGREQAVQVDMRDAALARQDRALAERVGPRRERLHRTAGRLQRTPGTDPLAWDPPHAVA